MIVFAIVCDLAFRTEPQVMDKEIIVAHESNMVTGGRKGSQSLAAALGQGFDFFIFEVVQVVIGCKGTAVNGLFVSAYQYAAFIGVEIVSSYIFNRRIFNLTEIQQSFNR